MSWPFHRYEVVRKSPVDRSVPSHRLPAAAQTFRMGTAQDVATKLGPDYAVRGITWPRWYLRLHERARR